MTEISKKSFVSKIYAESSALPEGHPNWRHFTTIEVDKSLNTFEINHRKTTYQKGYDDIVDTFYLYFELKDTSQIRRIYNFIDSEASPDRIGSCELTIDVEDATCVDNTNKQKEEGIEKIEISVNDEQILFYGGCVNSPFLKYYSEEKRGEGHCDKNNLNDFLEYLRQICETGMSSVGKPTPDKLEKKLLSIKYGDEVVKHLGEGDVCFENELYTPALSSYIRAIEWACIAHLQSKHGTDIITQEKNGNYYNFAGGQNSILDEVESDLDQKMISKLGGMNSAERRWMAHHKSGETLPEEVRAVRERARLLIENLFGD